MEELGVMVDLSHAGERAVFDVLDTATKPLIASHSGCKALRDHQRNLTDEQMRALAFEMTVLVEARDLHPAATDRELGDAGVRETPVEAEGFADLEIHQTDADRSDRAPRSEDQRRVVMTQALDRARQ